MESKLWEKFVFKTYKAVAVGPLKGNRRLQLLDVLVKRPHTLPALNRRNPVDVVDIGPLYEFSKTEGEADDDVAELKRLEDDLKLCNRKLLTNLDDNEESDDEEPLVIPTHQENITEVVRADSRVMGFLMKFANLESTASKVVACELKGVTILQVDRERLKEARDVWKPDLEKFKLHGNPQSTFRGRLDLWVITDILCADQIMIRAIEERSRDAGLEAGLDLGVLNQIVGLPPPAAVGIGHGDASGNYRVLEGKSIPFAIRTMHLCYDSNGELIHIGVDGGEKRIVVRGDDRPHLFNPVREPLYNMGDLFEDVPGNGGDDSYTPLPIVMEGDVAAESSSQAA